jgi:isoleucyl-tRNA synthetase
VHAREELSPAHNDVKGVMYLEGSDQHRGWFHSSLLTAVALNGHAPYQEVITHGFTVDAQGRKMSKSLGNVIAPQAVMKTLGADILRLWVASTDYANEISVSDEILKRVADSYRRLRNTARFLLGNLDGFDPERDLVAPGEMLLLDRWALNQALDLMRLARRVYGPEAGAAPSFGPDTYRYQTLAQELMRFCTVDLGAAYLDQTKDRLYTLPRTHPARRSAQSAMYWTLEIWCVRSRRSCRSRPRRSGRTCPVVRTLRCSSRPGPSSTQSRRCTRSLRTSRRWCPGWASCAAR